MKKNLNSFYFAFLLAICGSLSSSGQSFVDLLPIPDTLSGPNYALTIDSSMHRYRSGGYNFHTFSYNNKGLLGPTLIWHKGDSSQLSVLNNLGDTTTNHWHGAHVPPGVDGGPHQMITPGMTWMPKKIKMLDEPTTMWYHPHLHMKTQMQVNMGLAGLIIIRDKDDTIGAKLPHRYGTDEFPLIFQDRLFEYDSVTQDSVVNVDCEFGHTYIVNGIQAPILHVPAQMVRFHILNGSSGRNFMFGYSDQTQFKLIATDGGYTAKPYTMSNIPMAPGERSEWVTDFSGKQGETLYVVNRPQLLDPRLQGSPNPAVTFNCLGKFILNATDSNTTNLLQIIVDAPTANPVTTLASDFEPIAPYGAVDHNRFKELDTLVNKGFPYFFDRTPFIETVINDTILLNSTEKWTITNQTKESHPFHIHDINFLVTKFNGSTIIPDHLKGRKDVLMVMIHDTVEFITQFTTFSTTVDPELAYMYHCHILGHEDAGMMHQFVVINPNTGIAPVGNELAWNVYPNPTHDNSINISGACHTSSLVKVYDVKGGLAQEMKLPAFTGGINLPLANLPNGMYMVQWNRPDGVWTKKVIIQK
jgi:bilirubin oxidase